MLLNPFSIMMLFIASISVILGLSGSILALSLVCEWRRSLKTGEKHNGLESKINFAISLFLMLLALRLLSYPLFYAALQSFVKDIAGAMCIYGVTQILPESFRFLEIIKPIVFFLIGEWLIVHSLTRLSNDHSLMRRKSALLLVLSIAILVDSAGDLGFFLSINSHTPVTCCTLSLDSPDRISAILARYLLGQEYEQLLLPSFYLSNLILLGMIGYSLRKKRLEAKAFNKRRYLGLVFFMALINLFLTLLALLEVVGPRLMNLPYHHCPYCLLQYVPDSPLMIGLFVLGTYGIGWAFGLEIITTDKEAAVNLSGYLNKLYWFSFSGLSLSLVMVSVHLLLGSR